MNLKLNHQAHLTLITGPVRSGKTRLALQWAAAFPKPRAYLATAQGLDSEMLERIRRHQEERSSAFQTFEEPVCLSSQLEKLMDVFSIVVVDCLTLWISNLLGALGEEGQGARDQLDEFLSVLRRIKTPVILIGNEVGWGIVPDNALARTFRDLSGRLHQEIAQIADQVILMVAGIPMVVKREGR